MLFLLVTGQAEEIAKIRIYKGGAITWNHEKLELREADVRLKKLKSAQGTVWYYREDARGEPHPNAMKLKKLVMENRLPLSFSTEPDFSTVVLPDGSVKPRE